MVKSLTDHSQRSTALLIEPQTFFSLFSGEKADNQIKFKYSDYLLLATQTSIEYLLLLLTYNRKFIRRLGHPSQSRWGGK